MHVNPAGLQGLQFTGKNSASIDLKYSYEKQRRAS